MPNLAGQAAADMRQIIEDENGAGTAFTLIDDKGEYPVVGTLGDIGALANPITGVPVQGRSIEATVVMQTIKEKSGGIPARGWRARVNDTTLHVQRVEPDRTAGLFRLTLGLHLEDNENE